MLPLSRVSCRRWKVLLLAITVAGSATALCQFDHFVTVRGEKLMDGEQELRFVSYNIPNLHYIEDNHAFADPNPWRIADEFEIRDALMTIRQAGGKVTRLYVPSVRKEKDDPGIIRHVNGPGVFDDSAFVAYDRILQAANEYGVRVIIPFVDNWWWWGGPKEYAGFRGKPKEAFWTDSLIIADFKKTIAFMVNRVNSITGVPFKEDKAILGWETGNELQAPYAWTKEIAAYIKSLDTNHLLIEGTHAQQIAEESLLDPNLDVLSTHHYGPADTSLGRIVKAREKARGRKPYFVGEFGYIPTADVRRIVDTVVSTGVSGIMIWSLRGHNRDGGFYYHQAAYRWPGFESGKPWDENTVVAFLREKASKINGLRLEPPPAPEAPPRLLPIETPYKITWQGSAGASSYMIERKGEDDDLWQVIAPRAGDAVQGYRPLYADTTVELGRTYLYRVRARNSSGYSEPSEPVGPVVADCRMLVDDFYNDSRIFRKTAGVKFVDPADAGKAKEDYGRVAGQAGDFIEYALPGNIISVQVNLFSTKNGSNDELELFSGETADSLSLLAPTRQAVEPYPNEYGYYAAVSYRTGELPASHRYVRIVMSADCQLSRIEMKYRPAVEAEIRAAISLSN
ncbi:hypothetical protein EHM92_02765 [bacterium]|nr:MAG: hypothetical protein EHM92_02765 [bacterium]